MSKPRVSKLKRIGPPQNGGWFYYSPDGHIIGPFDYEEQMEKDIKEHYKEVEYVGHKDLTLNQGD